MSSYPPFSWPLQGPENRSLWLWPLFPYWTWRGEVRTNKRRAWRWGERPGDQCQMPGDWWDRKWVDYYRPLPSQIEEAEWFFPGRGEHPPWPSIRNVLCLYDHPERVRQMRCFEALEKFVKHIDEWMRFYPTWTLPGWKGPFRFHGVGFRLGDIRRIGLAELDSAMRADGETICPPDHVLPSTPPSSFFDQKGFHPVPRTQAGATHSGTMAHDAGQAGAPVTIAARPADELTPAKPRQSTQRGGAHEKLIAALTAHHQYAAGGCLKLEPIGNNQLARLAGVSNSTASEFFEFKFGGYDKYKALCADKAKLIASLRLLNNEYAPQILVGDSQDLEDKTESAP